MTSTKILECNLCSWITNNNNIFGIKRHEEWHDVKNSFKHASKNKIWGKVIWIIKKTNNYD